MKTVNKLAISLLAIASTGVVFARSMALSIQDVDPVSFAITGAEVVDDFYVAGDFNSWVTDDSDYKMSYSAGVYTLSGVNMLMEQGFKVTNGDDWYPTAGNYPAPETAKFDITYNASTHAVSATKVGNYDGTPAPYYLVGSFNSWTAKDTNYRFLKHGKQNANGHDQYYIDVSLSNGTEIKVVDDSNNWYPNGDNNNYKISADGDYRIYFSPEGNPNEDWHWDYFFVLKL